MRKPCDLQGHELEQCDICGGIADDYRCEWTKTEEGQTICPLCEQEGE